MEMKGILGRKIGMTEKFTKDGKVIPVTVVEVTPNVITQIKTNETDGYSAIQIAAVDKKEKNATKAEIGHAKKAGVAPKRFLKEIRVESTENYTLGSTIEKVSKVLLNVMGNLVDQKLMVLDIIDAQVQWEQ